MEVNSKTGDNISKSTANISKSMVFSNLKVECGYNSDGAFCSCNKNMGRSCLEPSGLKKGCTKLLKPGSNTSTDASTDVPLVLTGAR